MKQNLLQELNKYLADISVSYIKVHNLHWNVVGSDFKPVHEYLETIYDSYADVLDEIAELIKMHGEYPLASLKDYLTVSSIKEVQSRDISTKDALESALSDMKELREQAAKIRLLADEEDLFDIVSKMEDNIQQYNKNIWFLNSSGKSVISEN